MKECVRVLKPTGSIFYNHIDILSNHQTIHPSYVYDFCVRQVIIWDRQNTPKLDKSYFLPITEYIFWIQKDRNSKIKFNRKNALFNTNVWKIPPEMNSIFPAPFPIELPLNCISACTDINDIVLDPYCGSGTTGEACKKLNRDFIGFDISPIYCENAIKRLDRNYNVYIKKRNDENNYLF